MRLPVMPAIYTPHGASGVRRRSLQPFLMHHVKTWAVRFVWLKVLLHFVTAKWFHPSGSDLAFYSTIQGLKYYTEIRRIPLDLFTLFFGPGQLSSLLRGACISCRLVVLLFAPSTSLTLAYFYSGLLKYEVLLF